MYGLTYILVNWDELNVWVYKLTGGFRPSIKFEVKGVQVGVCRNLKRHTALVASQDGGHRSSFAKGADGCWTRAQISDKRVGVFIWARLISGDQPHSCFWEVQLEGPTRDNFQVPSESSVEVGEQRRLGLNDVTRAGGRCAVYSSTKTKKCL